MHFKKLFLLVTILLLCGVSYSQKTDTLLLVNGDRLVGEIKKLQYRILNYSVDGMGTLQIEWPRVAELKSNKTFEIKFVDGTKYVGNIRNTIALRTIVMVFQGGEESVSIEDIVEITPIKKRFINRIDGDLSAGYNFTKASQVGQFNLTGNIAYRTEKNSLEILVSQVITTQEDEESTKKQDGSLRWNHFYLDRWYWFTSGKFQQNTELGIRKRFLAEFGMGRTLVQKRRVLLNLEGGFLGSHEQSTDSLGTTTNNLEGLVQLDYRLFKIIEPEVNINTILRAFPSISNPGRMRARIDINAKIELVKDLFFSLTFWDDFDNKPRSEEASENDWGVVTSIGYSF